MNLTKEDLMILEEIINEEIHNQIDSGYKESDYVKILRDDMPPNNSWVIMTKEDFERNNK